MTHSNPCIRLVGLKSAAETADGALAVHIFLSCPRDEGSYDRVCLSGFSGISFAEGDFFFSFQNGNYICEDLIATDTVKTEKSCVAKVRTGT